MNPPRVLQLLGPSTGGIRRHVAYLREQLVEAGWEVRVAGPEGVVDDLDHVVPVPPLDRPLAVLRSRRALAPLVGDVDLVHAHGLKVGWVASSLRPRPPLVVSVHNLVLDDVAGRKAWFLRRLEGWLPGRADATIAISDEVARRFRGRAGADRIHVIPPAGPPPAPTRAPGEVRAELGVGPDDELVVTAARLTAQKGLDLLVDAAARAVRSRPSLRWFVFGDGVLRPDVEAAIRARGLEGVVHLAGARPDVDDELAAADVVAVTSQWESGPLVVLEALALGRPVVSTDVGLVPEVIGPSDGRVVPVGDAAAFADALCEVLARGQDDAAGAAGGVAGSSAALRPPALASAVASVYREVLHAR